MQPQPIEPMEHASSFVEFDELDPVALPSQLERRIGMAAAVAIGMFGVAMAISMYVLREELFEALLALVLFLEFIFGAN